MHEHAPTTYGSAILFDVDQVSDNSNDGRRAPSSHQHTYRQPCDDINKMMLPGRSVEMAMSKNHPPQTLRHLTADADESDAKVASRE